MADWKIPFSDTKAEDKYFLPIWSVLFKSISPVSSLKKKKKSLRHFKLFLIVPEILKKVKEDVSTGQSEAGRHTHLRTPLKEILEAAGLLPLPFKQVKCKFRFDTLSLANQKEVFTCHWPSHQ